MNDHDKIYFNWTQTAIECYKIGCWCSKCKLRKIIESPCYMKKTVIAIVRNIGRPPNIMQEGIFKHLNSTQMLIIEAILEGAKTKKEIAKVIGKRETLVQNSLCEIYKKSSLQGVVYKTKLKRLDELIKFLEKYKENKNEG